MDEDKIIETGQSERNRMRAWLVREKGEFFCTVVFAETRGKARALALTTDACEDANFCDIEVHRIKEADKLYSGRSKVDWDTIAAETVGVNRHTIGKCCSGKIPFAAGFKWRYVGGEKG